MNTGVGKKKSVAGKLTIVFAVLIIFSILDTFSVTVHDDADKEVLNDVNKPQDNGLSPQPHGVRSAEPSWSSLSGSLPATDDYYGIDFGDVNNDGKLDVIVASGQMNPDGGIHCWIGDGNGGWIEQSNGLPTFDWFTDVEVDDFNNDGKLDIASSNWSGSGGGIWTGNGGEGGTMVWTMQNGPPAGWNGVALGDVDNNGTIDVVVGIGGGVKVWTSNGGAGGTFVWTDSSGSLPTSGQYYGVSLGDVNNDGDLDLVAASNSDEGIKVWTGNGESGSSAIWTNVSSGTGLPQTGSYAQVCFGDANNDGKLDVAAASQSFEGVKFWKGNGGEGGFSWIEESYGLATSGQFFGLSFGDVNNDGKLDLVGANNSGGRIEVWLGDGGEGGEMDWTPATEGLPSGSGIIDVCLGDVNNDGRTDIGATTNSQGVQVWAGNLPDLEITGWTEASINLPNSTGWYDVVFGDVNHDGKLDLAATSSSGQGVKVWLGDGMGVWSEVLDFDLPSSGSYNGVRLKDVDHDGNLDVIAGKDDMTGLYVWLGNGSGGFSADTGPGGSTEMGGVEVADIDNDGNMDIASSLYWPSDLNPVYVWLGDGNGGWGPNTGPLEGKGYDDVTLGDVDHNGTMDLFATTHMNGFRFWLGDGKGGWSLQPQNGLPIVTSPPWMGGLGACFGDVNHDGDLDVAIGGYNGNFGMRVYTSDGGEGGEVDWGNSSDGLPAVGQYGGVELGDINNDGNPDILSANNAGTSSGISITLGNGGQGGSIIWTSLSLPDLPSSGNYWGAALGDVNNDGVLDIAITSDSNGVEVYITQTISYYGIDLLEGWNLISLPLIQSDTTVGNVMASIDGDYRAVQCHDSGNAGDPWKHYAPDKPSQLNDLADVDHAMGIWIYVTQPGGTTLTVNGSEIGINQTITIRPGWNLVGYPSRTDKPRNVALNNVLFGTDVDWVGYFDAETDTFVTLSDTDNMELTRGYWIHSVRQDDIVWNVPL